MKKNGLFLFTYLSIVVFLLWSCTPDCREVTVSIADWQTHYVDDWIETDSVISVREMVDTTVAYTIEKYYTKMAYSANSNGRDTSGICTHYVTIRNNNDSYSNRFAIKIEGREYDASNGSWHNLSKTSNFVIIYPNSSYTFQLSHSDWWHNKGNSEGNVSLRILQISNYVERKTKRQIQVKRRQKRRIDKLVTKDTILNNCDCDIDAIKAKSEAVSEVFYSLEKQNLIQSK